MPIIKNYGLRWRRDRISWGAGSRRGHLSGILVNSKTSGPVDFREQIGIYILYEPGFAPIYVGQAGNGNARLYSRLKSHRDGRLRDRWEFFSWFGFRDVGGNGELLLRQKPTARVSLQYAGALNEIEGVLIQALEPRLNKQGARWQKTADEYVQSRPEEKGPMDIISEKIDGLNVQLEAFEKRIFKKWKEQ